MSESTSFARSPARQRDWILSALEEHEASLTRYAVRLTGSDELARDAVQHTFLRMCDASPDDIGDSVAGWLYTVCRNKSLDFLRRKGRHQGLELRYGAEPAAREADPAELAETSDLSAWLRRLFGELPDSQREVVDLILEGFSYRQIAEITSRSPGNVRVMMHRAIERLRNHPQVQALLSDRAAHPTQSAPKPAQRASS